MAFEKNISRKIGFIAEILLTFADLTSGSVLEVIDCQSGTVVDEVIPVLDKTFDPTNTAVIEFGISDDTNKFVASQNIFTGQTLGGRAGDVTGRGYRFSEPGAIVAKYTSGGGTATQGQIRLIAHLHYENESEFVVS